MGASGSNFAFHPSVDSPSTPGEKCVLSDAIENTTAEQLLEGMEKYIRDGKTATGKETKFSVTDKGDHLLTALEFDISALAGGGTASVFNRYYFDKAKLEMKCNFYQSKRHYENEEAQFTHMARIHRDPVKVEFWSDHHECRSAGIIMERMMAKLLSDMGTSAKATMDTASPSDPTKLSVVSDEIKDCEVTPSTFLDTFRQFIVGLGGVELPDGTIVEERAVLGMFARSFAKHEFAEGRVYCHEYGEDESLSEEIGITHVVVHKEPFRIEQWNVAKPGRRFGEAQQKIIEEFTTGVLKQMSES